MGERPQETRCAAGSEAAVLDEQVEGEVLAGRDSLADQFAVAALNAELNPGWRSNDGNLERYRQLF